VVKAKKQKKILALILSPSKRINKVFSLLRRTALLFFI
jgi:hypothetical protein